MSRQPLIRTYVGISLDGFISTPDGLCAWEAAPGGPAGHGAEAFMDECSSLIMGRTSFDQAFPFWLDNWPYKDKKVYVLTSRPLPENAPKTVIAAQGGPAGAAQQAVCETEGGDVHLLGGAQTIQAFLDLGLIDRFGFCLLPVLLGKGIPFFNIHPAPFSKPAWDNFLANPPETKPRPTLKLDRHHAYPDGALEIVYRKETER